MLEFCSKWCCWGCMEGGIIHEAKGEEWWNSGLGEERANSETHPNENIFLQNKRQKVDGWQSSMIVNKCISLKTNTKNSGWKTTFLLQWPLIRGRFSLQGCICKYPWLFMIVFYRYEPSIKLLYLTTPTCLAWWRVRNMLNPRLHLALLSLKPTFPKAKLKYFYGRISVSSTDIENAKALVHKSHSWHLLKKFGLIL